MFLHHQFQWMEIASLSLLQFALWFSFMRFCSVYSTLAWLVSRMLIKYRIMTYIKIFDILQKNRSRTSNCVNNMKKLRRYTCWPDPLTYGLTLPSPTQVSACCSFAPPPVLALSNHNSLLLLNFHFPPKLSRSYIFIRLMPALLCDTQNLKMWPRGIFRRHSLFPPEK